MHHEIVMKDGNAGKFALDDLGDNPAGSYRIQVSVLRHGTTDSFDDTGLYHPDPHLLQLLELFIEPRDHGAYMVQTTTLIIHNIGINAFPVGQHPDELDFEAAAEGQGNVQLQRKGFSLKNGII